MESKHTPGPWHSFKNNEGRYVSTGKRSHDSIICHLDETSKWEDLVKANSKLISAAPDMLELLLRIKKACDDSNIDIPSPEYKTLVDVIKKATE